MGDNTTPNSICRQKKTGISLPEVLNALVCSKSVVSVGFGERDAKIKNKIVTLNMT